MDNVKRYLIISNIILTLAVLSIFFFHILPQRSKVSDQTPQPSIVFGDTTKGGKGLSIAYINTDSVVDHYKYYTELKSKLENE
jgi:hypothetical protein